jgi:uncharacterized membrane protein YdfJ with MMPL/SSD domain
MRALSHRCIAHRRAVIVAWVLIAIVLTVIASAVGRNYANDFSLPNTQSQHVTDLLKSEFILGDERTLREFGFGLAAAVFLDALIVRCVMLPAVLELLGSWTWKLPGWLDRALLHINIEGRTAAAEAGAAEERGPREIAG